VTKGYVFVHIAYCCMLGIYFVTFTFITGTTLLLTLRAWFQTMSQINMYY